jgi:hypothetical protein
LKRYLKPYCRKELHSKHSICESLAHKVERKNPVFANILEIKIILMPGPGMKYVVCHKTFSEEKYVNISYIYI